MSFLRQLGKKRPAAESQSFELGSGDAGELESTFSAPHWLKDLGRTSWLLVGVFALLAGLTWLLGTTSTIVGPLVAGTIVATVAMPIVSWLARRMQRAAAAALVLLGLVALAVLVGVLVIGGITSQNDSISADSSAAADKAQGWLEDMGVNSSGSSSAKSTVEQDVPKIISTLVHGVINGIQGLTSLAFGARRNPSGLCTVPSVRPRCGRQQDVPCAGQASDASLGLGWRS